MSNLLIPLVLLIFNAATIVLLAVCLRGVSFAEALAEKGHSLRPAPRQAAAAADAATLDQPAERASYSRIAGLIGAVVMATFFWAVANVTLAKMITEPQVVAKSLEGVFALMFAGAAMFLPYAANQLRELFAPRA